VLLIVEVDMVLLLVVGVVVPLVTVVDVVPVLVGVVEAVLKVVLRVPVEVDDFVVDDDVPGAQVFCAVTLLSRRVTAPFKA